MTKATQSISHVLAELDKLLPPDQRPKRRRPGASQKNATHHGARHKKGDIFDDLLAKEAERQAKWDAIMERSPLTRRELHTRRTPTHIVHHTIEQTCTCGATYTAMRFTTPMVEYHCHLPSTPQTTDHVEVRPPSGHLPANLPVRTETTHQHLTSCQECLTHPLPGEQLTLPFPEEMDPIEAAKTAFYTDALTTPNHYPKHKETVQ